MVWFVVIVVLVLLVVFARFRKFAVWVVALLALLGGLLYFQNRYEERSARERITKAELAFEDMSLKPVYGNYRLGGRLKNNSASYTLRQVRLVVTMQDCEGQPPAQHCVAIAESKETLFFTIPPGQARDFDQQVYFMGGRLKPKGRLDWTYSVTEIKAD